MKKLLGLLEEQSIHLQIKKRIFSIDDTILFLTEITRKDFLYCLTGTFNYYLGARIKIWESPQLHFVEVTESCQFGTGKWSLSLLKEALKVYKIVVSS